MNAQKTIKLNTLKNMAYIIAKTNLEQKGVYYCVIDGVKTQVVK